MSDDHVYTITFRNNGDTYVYVTDPKDTLSNLAFLSVSRIVQLLFPFNPESVVRALVASSRYRTSRFYNDAVAVHGELSNSTTDGHCAFVLQQWRQLRMNGVVLHEKLKMVCFVVLFYHRWFLSEI